MIQPVTLTNQTAAGRKKLPPTL